MQMDTISKFFIKNEKKMKKRRNTTHTNLAFWLFIEIVTFSLMPLPATALSFLAYHHTKRSGLSTPLAVRTEYPGPLLLA